MAATDSLIGKTISHYRIVEKIGAGGMGEVYRAHDEQLDRDVALKVLPTGMLGVEASRKQFRKEALALAKLNHPNIETVFEFSSQGGVDFLVMELIPGQSLSLKLRDGPLPQHELTRLAAQLAEGLAAAHEQGVIHRDLKPANLFVTPDGRLKILDFGLAKLLHPALATDVTRSVTIESKSVLGTVPYMSPEQLRGESADARSDIYSAGAVLYEMATGQRPFPQTQGPQLMGAILHQSPPLPRSIDPHIASSLEGVILKALEKDISLRYQTARELRAALEGLSSIATSSAAAPELVAVNSRATRRRWPLLIVGVPLASAALAAGGWLYHARKAHTLTESDTVVLADFANTTGDAVFDDTLKQALAVDLAQSPFLNILSEAKVRQTLRQMTRAPGERLTPDLAREVCQRAESKAYFAGSIAALGTQYVIGLEAMNCASGDVLAREQVTAAGKEQVLPALGRAASRLRREVGESLKSVQKFDVPLSQATTNSLEALQAMTLGGITEREKGDVEALPLYKRAIELDPNFALAYENLGISYSNLNQPKLAAEYLKRAFDLRDRITEREKFAISADYYGLATGELEKSNQTYEMGMQVYPRDSAAYGNLASNYMILGQYEKAAAANREALRLDPADAVTYSNLGQIYMALNRFDEARTTTEEALTRKLEDVYLNLNLYALAFFQADAAAMKKQVDWAIGKPGVEDWMLSLESDTEAWSGNLGKARESSKRAVANARRNGDQEPAALWQANAGIREALFGNATAARRNAAAAVTLAPASHNAEAQAALAYALADDTADALALADDLDKRFPLDTVVQSAWLPTIHAQIETSRKNPVRGIELLQVAAPYELGMLTVSAPNSCLYPVYVRALAYLNAKQGQLAAAEFQKILDHRGLIWNCATGSLAILGLARANVIQGDSGRSRAAYQNFLTQWKDADPDVPVLKQAKEEIAKLQ